MSAGDEHVFPDGGSFIETECGPNVYGMCADCGASAGCHLFAMVSQVRCGRCWALRHQLLPGQRNYELQSLWRKENPVVAQRVA